MPLSNCKVHLELNWTKDCVMSTIADKTFKITNTKLYVTLSSKDNVKPVKLLKEGFKRLGCWKVHQKKKKNRNKRFTQHQSYKISSWCFFSRS